jgi:hypothetical protein
MKNFIPLDIQIEVSKYLTSIGEEVIRDMNIEEIMSSVQLAYPEQKFTRSNITYILSEGMSWKWGRCRKESKESKETATMSVDVLKETVTASVDVLIAQTDVVLAAMRLELAAMEAQMERAIERQDAALDNYGLKLENIGLRLNTIEISMANSA